MNFTPESNDIYYFVVDFFNDLTGMDKYYTKLWDLQSKGDKNVFDYSNIKEKALKSMKDGLKKENHAKEYINNSDIDDTKINDFIQKVTIVIVSQHTPAEYVKAIIKNHPHIIPDEATLIAIFNEIRDKQSEKKNVNTVENITYSQPEPHAYIQQSQDTL